MKRERAGEAGRQGQGGIITNFTAELTGEESGAAAAAAARVCLILLADLGRRLDWLNLSGAERAV